MQTTTFLGEIQGGQIRTDQPLAAFEGRRVVITLSASPAPASEAESPFAPEEAELLDDAGRIRVPPREVAAVRLSVVDVGRRPMRVYPSDEEG